MPSTIRRLGTATTLLLLSLLAATACTTQEASADPGAASGIDSLNARLENVYRAKDPRAYTALFTDSAMFEWPAAPTVRGKPALQAMATELWPPLVDLQLRIVAGTRRLAPEHATEFGGFEESWRDSTGARVTEYGRYAALFARGKDGGWLIDRWFGFSDSTHTTPAAK